MDLVSSHGSKGARIHQRLGNGLKYQTSDVNYPIVGAYKDHLGSSRGDLGECPIYSGIIQQFAGWAAEHGYWCLL